MRKETLDVPKCLRSLSTLGMRCASWLVLLSLFVGAQLIFGQWTPPTDRPPFHRRPSSTKASETRAHGAGTESEFTGVRLVPTLLSAVLTVRTDYPCILTIDRGHRQTLSEDQSRTLKLAPGEHVISAKSMDGVDHWRQILVMPERGHQEIAVTLLAMRQAREQSEPERNRLSAEIVRLEERISKNRQVAVETRAARERLVEQKNSERAKEHALLIQVDQLVNQIRADEKQMAQELAQATQDETDALRANGSAAYGASQRTTLGNLTAIAGTVAVVVKRRSAENHRQRAQQLLGHIQDLTHQIYALTN